METLYDFANFTVADLLLNSKKVRGNYIYSLYKWDEVEDDKKIY